MPAIPDTVGRWTPHESAMLAAAHAKFGDGKWTQLSKWLLANHVYRCPTQCRHRWQKTMRPDLKKGHWSKAEDDILVIEVRRQQSERNEHVTINWQNVGRAVTCRTGKACRERWVSHLCPGIDHSPITDKEGEIILQLYRATEYHNRWSKIAERLPGRTAEAVKSKWKTLTGFRWQGNANKPDSRKRQTVLCQAVLVKKQKCDDEAPPTSSLADVVKVAIKSEHNSPFSLEPEQKDHAWKTPFQKETEDLEQMIEAIEENAEHDNFWDLDQHDFQDVDVSFLFNDSQLTCIQPKIEG